MHGSKLEQGDARQERSDGRLPVSRVAVAGAFPLAVLLALASLGGVTHAGTYARESANWRAQAVGQDWVDLVLAVPWLIASGVAALAGSRAGTLLLAGAFAYSAYELAIYAFALHFNALFLIYCAGLGLASWSFGGVTLTLSRAGAAGWFARDVPRRLAGGWLIGVGALFALLWLGEIVPALARGTVPSSVALAEVPTNPVEVLDLALVLPAHVVVGVMLLRRHVFAPVLASIVLAFGVLMAASIAGMLVYMHVIGVEPSLGVAGAMSALSVATGAVLAGLLRCLR